MKRSINKPLLILLLVFVSIQIWAQPTLGDSALVSNYWKKRGVIEVVYASMQDFLTINPTALAEKKGMDAYLDKYIKRIDYKSIPDIERDYEGLSDFLVNNNWKSTAKKLFSPLKERIDKKAELDYDFFSVINAPGDSCLKIQQSIINKYLVAIKEFKKIPDESMPNIMTNNGSGVSSGLPSRSSYTKSSIYDLWHILAFIAGLIIGGILVYFNLKRKVLSIFKSEKKEYKSILNKNGRKPFIFTFLSIIEILKYSKDEYKSPLEKMTTVDQLDILKHEITELKGKNKELFDENIGLGQKIEKLTLKSELGHNKTKSLNESSNIQKNLFYNIPEIDGSFKIESAKDFKDQDSLYKLEIISNTNGNIFFLSGDYDLRAIENIDYYLNPVCEVQNIANRDFAKKVEMVNKGTILLNGDLWKIKDKIKIKLV